MCRCYMQVQPWKVWGHRCVRPIYDVNGNAKPVAVYDAMEELDLQLPVEVHFFKIMAFKNPMAEWCPDRIVPISPLQEHLTDIPSILFWRGEAAELEADAERRRKLLEAAARARARAAAGPAKPRNAAPKRKRPRTAQQEKMWEVAA